MLLVITLGGGDNAYAISPRQWFNRKIISCYNCRFESCMQCNTYMTEFGTRYNTRKSNYFSENNNLITLDNN